ncbi:MAG: hypothetical protein ACJAYF_003258 [Arenicella sp.]|jgi:hypothetical protein
MTQARSIIMPTTTHPINENQSVTYDTLPYTCLTPRMQIPLGSTDFSAPCQTLTLFMVML